MRERLILFLKQFPPLHRIIQAWYWRVQSLKAHIFGTRIEEKRWTTRPVSLNDCWGGVKHPHRVSLIKKIATFLPIFNILEIGCNYGPNLYLLAKKFPNIEIKGIDINPIAVQSGNEWLRRSGFKNVKLSEGRADDLSQFSDKSFDIVFTDAVLMYIGPDKIKKVIREMLRIVRKALILVEWHQDLERDSQGLGIYHFGHWKRNYLNLLKQFIQEDQIRLIKIPEEFRLDENWRKLGYIIEVIL